MEGGGSSLCLVASGGQPPLGPRRCTTDAPAAPFQAPWTAPQRTRCRGHVRKARVQSWGPLPQRTWGEGPPRQTPAHALLPLLWGPAEPSAAGLPPSVPFVSFRNHMQQGPKEPLPAGRRRMSPCVGAQIACAPAAGQGVGAAMAPGVFFSFAINMNEECVSLSLDSPGGPGSVPCTHPL